MRAFNQNNTDDDYDSTRKSRRHLFLHDAHQKFSRLCKKNRTNLEADPCYPVNHRRRYFGCVEGVIYKILFSCRKNNSGLIEGQVARER